MAAESFRQRIQSYDKHYKRVFQGYNPDDRNAEFLLFNISILTLNCR